MDRLGSVGTTIGSRARNPGRSGWGLWMSSLGYPPGQWTASPGTLPAGLGNRLEDAQFWACRRGAPGRVGPHLSRPWANLGHRLGLRHTDFRGRPRQPLAAPRSPPGARRGESGESPRAARPRNFGGADKIAGHAFQSIRTSSGVNFCPGPDGRTVTSHSARMIDRFCSNGDDSHAAAAPSPAA